MSEQMKTNQLLLEPKFIDLSTTSVTICIQDNTGKEYKCAAHKNILEAKSIVFKTMFMTEMIEKKTLCVKIKHENHLDLLAFLEFVYTGKIQLTEHYTILGVLNLAEQYEVCEIENEITQNVLNESKAKWNNEIEEVFHFISRDVLKYSSALSKIMTHLKPHDKFITKDIFLKLPVNAALFFIMTANTESMDQTFLFELFSRWCITNIKEEEQSKVFRKFADYIDFTKVGLDDIISEIYPTNLVSNEKLLKIIANSGYKRWKNNYKTVKCPNCKCEHQYYACPHCFLAKRVCYYK